MSERFANPRLIDVFGSNFTQGDVEFAIPRLKEDIPFYMDPVLLWNSHKSDYKHLNKRLIEFLRYAIFLVNKRDINQAALLFSGCEEQQAMGLGYASGSKRGNNIGPKLIGDILRVIESVPQLKNGEIRHLEELQLVVPGIAEDRISDTACSLLKDYFIEFTENQAKEFDIPTRTFRLGHIYDEASRMWSPAPKAQLPFNPFDETPILLVPLDLLRLLPWINYPDYYRTTYAPHVLPVDLRQKSVAKAVVLAYNARNYVEVERYVDDKEKTGHRCRPDPLFKPLSISTLKSKFSELRELPIGRSEGADRKFEDLLSDLFSSLFYPTLEFAESRSRTISGVHIRDLIFYNDGKATFWDDLRQRYDAKQPVFELKNVVELQTEHVNQLYRYLDEEFGRFGVLVTRNPTPKPVQRNIVDLHSSKRVAILCLNDRDLELMVSLVESNRDPTDVIKKSFIEFTRLLPK